MKKIIIFLGLFLFSAILAENFGASSSTISPTLLTNINANTTTLQSRRDANKTAKRKVINLFGGKYGDFSIPSALENLQLKLGDHHKSDLGTVTYNGASIDIGADTGDRAFVNWSDITTLVEGNDYVITFEITNLVGAVNNIVSIGSAKVTVDQNGRYGTVFKKTNQTILRIGNGVSYASNAAASFTLSNVMIQNITGFGDKFDDFVNRQTTSIYQAGNTLVAGKVITSQSNLISTNFRDYNQGVSTGDSFSNDINDFPQLFNQISSYIANNMGYPGRRISGDIEDNWQAWLDNPINADADFAILQGGTNDINSSISLEAMQTAWIAMADKATAKGITKALILNVSPWAGYGLDTVKKQKVLDWNAWLVGQTEQRGYLLIDIFTLLQDKSGLFRLDPEYILGAYTGNYTYTGDTIHPNTPARFAIVNLMKAAIEKINTKVTRFRK